MHVHKLSESSIKKWQQYLTSNQKWCLSTISTSLQVTPTFNQHSNQLRVPPPGSCVKWRVPSLPVGACHA